MSLVGNLEDLSLGDILQIISLSQKFGVLVLESERGSARMVFSSGLVRGACLTGVQGHFSDLRSLVVGKGILDPAGFDACEARASDLGMTVEEMLRSEAALDVDRLDRLIQEAVEAAVLEMFTWPSGDFSFDVRSDPEAGDPQLLLRSGISAQYLAMEGMRQRDEADRGAAAAEVGPEEGDSSSLDDLVAGPMFAGENDDCSEEFVSDPPDAFLDDFEAELRENDAKDEFAEEFADLIRANEIATVERSVGPVLEAEPATTSVASATRVHARPLIVIDPDVLVLEWVKLALQDEFRHVHIFQQADQGLMRIRQYLIRGELPAVLISPEVEVDPLSGIHGLVDFVKRLKSQAAQLPIFGLIEGEQQPAAGPQGALDGMLVRPPRKQLRAKPVDALEAPARSLSEALAGYLPT